MNGSAIDGVNAADVNADAEAAVAVDALVGVAANKSGVLAEKDTGINAKAGPNGSGSVFCRVVAVVDRNGEGASNGDGADRLSRSAASLIVDFEGFLVISDLTVGGLSAITCTLFLARAEEEEEEEENEGLGIFWETEP